MANATTVRLTTCAEATAVKKPDTAHVVEGGVVAGVVSAFRRTLHIPFALCEALDDDIQDWNEGEVEERGGNHAAGDGRAH